MRVGMLTGGGDCPGLNAVMRAVVRKGETHFGDELLGFLDGWKGVIENRADELDVERMRGTLPRGGTVLGSSRTNPYKIDGGVDRVKETLAKNSVDALIAIGGEDTLGVADRLSDEGVDVVGVPKTIDNDLSATELTFGFDTAVQICVDAIDRLHTTAESHDRVMVVEVMGRHAGHIAVWAGIAGGATMVLIPEEPFDIEEVCAAIQHRHETKGRYASIVVVAEGATPKEGTISVHGSGEVDAFGHARLGGIGDALAQRDRGAHRLRDARHRARPRAARRHADRVRPGAGHPVRRSPPSTRCTTAPSARWWRCGAATSCGCRCARRPASSSSSTPTCTTSPRSSSVDRRPSSAADPRCDRRAGARHRVDHLETLMLRRNVEVSFGGMWVFPGGRVEPDDGDGEPRRRRAAAREAAEEAGLVVDSELLVPFAHWTPPPVAPKRFATWFFLAPAPAGVVSIDGGEIHDHVWVHAERRRSNVMRRVRSSWRRRHGSRCTGSRRLRTSKPPCGVRAPSTVEYFSTHIAKGEDGELVAVWHGDVAYEGGDLAVAGGRHRLAMIDGGWRYERSSVAGCSCR